MGIPASPKTAISMALNAAVLVEALSTEVCSLQFTGGSGKSKVESQKSKISRLKVKR
jgi:hypothetical protein